ncbi:glutathione S-transferase T3-like protein [Tanacetum coccineum]
MGEDKRSYDSVNCKWKNRIRPKVSQFCEIYNSVRDRHQSGSCDNTVYQEAELEYRTIYNAPFTLTECWKILKDHPKWKKVEMPKFYIKSKQSSSKKSRTSENTSQGNSDLAHIGVNLNDEAADSEDVEAKSVNWKLKNGSAKEQENGETEDCSTLKN